MSTIAELREVCDSADTAFHQAWDAHEKAMENWNKEGGIIGSEACCDAGITYGLYLKASRVFFKAQRAWLKALDEKQEVKEKCK